MTDTDITAALADLSKSVTEHRVQIAGKISTLTANVSTLQGAHDANTKKLDTADRLHIESELQAARDEVTGQQDVERTEKTEATIRRRFGDNGGRGAVAQI
jgi:hypothetical protein